MQKLKRKSLLQRIARLFNKLPAPSQDMLIWLILGIGVLAAVCFVR